MAKLDVEGFCDRAKKGFDELDSNRKLFEDCYDYNLPYRNTFSGNGKTINRPTKQFDSTALIASQNFVNTMQSSFTPPFTRWAEFKAGPGIPEKMRPKFNKDLQKLTELVFAYLNASNFATASTEAYFDWGIGTGGLWLFEGDEQSPLNFVSTPMSQMGLVEGRFGSVDGRFRKWRIKARLITATWPKAKLNEDLKEKVKDAPEEEVEFIEGCNYDYEELVWHYQVIHEASKHVLTEKDYPEEICFTPRWMKIPGFAYGIGPFALALLDVKTLNRIKELMLQSAALNIFGIYTVAGGGAFNPNTTTLNPATFIPVERNGGPNGPSIAPLPRSGDFQAQEFMIQDLKESIKKVMLDNKLPAETPQPKTAFEIAQRIKEFQVDIGAAYGRAMFEFVQPLFKRIVAILSRKRLIKLPDGFAIDNFFVQVQVVSPIAQQQNMEDVQRLINNMTMVAQVAGPVIGSQLVMSAYEIEKLPQWLAEKVGPIALMRDQASAEQMQQMMAKMQGQMMAQQAQPAQQGA